MTDIPRNKFKVPAQQWKKWTIVGRHVFNKVYEYSVSNQDMMSNTEKGVIPEDQYRVIAWNHAFIAADVTSRGERALLKELTKEIRGHV